MKYSVYVLKSDGVVKQYSVCDSEEYPTDPDKYLPNHHEWYRKEMLASFTLAVFPVHARQTDIDARTRAYAFADYANRQYAAVQSTMTSITL
jgi:hypothetical protein